MKLCALIETPYTTYYSPTFIIDLTLKFLSIGVAQKLSEILKAMNYAYITRTMKLPSAGTTLEQRLF